MVNGVDLMEIPFEVIKIDVIFLNRGTVKVVYVVYEMETYA
jgi:hypothetical protein